LLLQRGELGERRIGIRLLVAPIGAAVRFGEVFLPLGTIDTLALTPPMARSIVTTPAAILPIRPRCIVILALLALVPILPRLTVMFFVSAVPMPALARGFLFGRRVEPCS
jgi:hypothetical protein